jgi:hypothetical protein
MDREMQTPDLKEFAQRYRLKLVSELKAAKLAQRLDGQPKCDVEHIPGRRGWIRADRRLFHVFVRVGRNLGPILTEMKALGFEGSGRGDVEVFRLFDPANEAQAAYAIRLIGARRRRQVSEAQRQHGRELAARFGYGNTRQSPERPVAAPEAVCGERLAEATAKEW